MPWLPLLIAVMVALAPAAATRPVLRWLGAPEPTPPTPDAAGAPPAPDEAAGDAVDFGALATGRFAGIVGLLTLGAGLIAYGLLPPAAWLAWTALVAPGALAIAVDGATTWIPYALTLTMAVTAAVGVLLWALLAGNAWIVASAALGALLTGGFFHLFHRLTRGGIGYADVRLMAVAGAVCAPVSAQVGLWAPLMGTIIGAGWGVARLLWRGRGEFAYGPSLWAGPFVALLLDRLL